MVKAFKIGDKVRIDSKEFPFMGLPEDVRGALLTVDEFQPPAGWVPVYEVRDSKGNSYGILESALTAA